MSEPTTEAGRRLLDDILDPELDAVMLAGIARAAILAIEAEARADLAARIEARVAEMGLRVRTAEGDEVGFPLNRQDVLDAIREEAAK